MAFTMKLSRQVISSLVFLLMPFHIMAAQPPSPHGLVIAHYHMPFAPHGATQSGYREDIDEAQSIGVNAFVLNFGSWLPQESLYQRRLDEMFKAAFPCKTGFRLALSFDLARSGLSPYAAADALSRYFRSPCYLHINGRPAIFSWGGEAETEKGSQWRREFASRFGSEDKFFFVPHVRNGAPQKPEEGIPRNESEAHSFLEYLKKRGDDSIFFYSGPNQINGVQYGRLLSAYTNINTDSKSIFISISPAYVGLLQPQRRAFDYGGLRDFFVQWEPIFKSTKNVNIELFTWNDIGEGTFFSPSKDIPATASAQLQELDFANFSPRTAIYNITKTLIYKFHNGILPPDMPISIYGFLPPIENISERQFLITAANTPNGKILIPFSGKWISLNIKPGINLLEIPKSVAARSLILRPRKGVSCFSMENADQNRSSPFGASFEITDSSTNCVKSNGTPG
ncbi:hypothetical protein KGA65_16990 [Ideonella sp. B7]|uniref:endo-1,3-alpha-glucanase family glycosylhydrolase n=1 Tax=Ideonella benzenivorans TaxID=2831643 RepID=UPI001CEC6510|nr:endo-1,3-alpha-glucanase family glycosylhydrolase [Ideonella benzenivorans]MCA6218232.1 hypothetical protein [Ideonella benzenivorans]